jgi:hypothetical protein
VSHLKHLNLIHPDSSAGAKEPEIYKKHFKKAGYLFKKKIQTASSAQTQSPLTIKPGFESFGCVYHFDKP